MDDPEIIRGDKKYWFIGAAIAFFGVAIVRVDVWLWKESALFRPLYAVGIIVAIVGLALITKGIDKKREGFRYCPHCMSLNPSDAKVCRKCKKSLPPVKPKKRVHHSS